MSPTSVFGLLTLVAASLAAPAIGQDRHAPYESELAAVLAAANTYNPLSISNDREYMGTVYRLGNRYGFSVTAGEKGADSVSLRVPKLHWSNVVALWHTHGNAAKAHRYFSDVDTETVNRHCKPFYLADYTGYLKVYKPGDPTMSPYAAGRLGLPANQGFATGDLVRDQSNRPIRVNVRLELGAS